MTAGESHDWTARPERFAASGRDPQDALLEGLLLLCRLYDRPSTAGELTAGLPLAEGRMTLTLLRRAGARADLDVRVKHEKRLGSIAAELLPVLLVQRDGTVCVLSKIEDGRCTILLPDMESREHVVSRKDLEEEHSGLVILAAPLVRADGRAEGFAGEPRRHWFWGEFARYKWNVLEVALAAAVANLLAVTTSLFSMQVYDRVVPNLAFATLWVLAVGVGLAIFIEAVMRIVRSHLVDIVGRRLDLALSSRVFERALGMRLEARPKSTGSFTNQVREFDAVREFFTSTTIGALSDFPFVLLFIGIIAMIGGPVAWVLAAAVPCIVLPGILAQWPLSRMSRMHLKEGSIRNGLLIEAMSGAETVKTLQGEGHFQRLWEEYTALLAGNGARMRALSSTLTYSATAVQQSSYVLVMVVGVYQIAAGHMTSGGLLACAILSSRTTAPLTQLAGIFSRWQHMRAALKGMEAIMQAPIDRPAERKFVHRPRLAGAYRLEEMAFRYDQDSEPALRIPALAFEPGTATALLGANGSGKSTLLKLLAGLYQPAQGQLVLDGTDIRQIDPADVRRAIAYLPQDVRLFYGTLRDNLNLGLTARGDEELLEALAFVGAEGLVRDHPLGLDRQIGEGGAGVSGGQRQSIGLARIWLRDPRIVLLDEPTAAMDQALEMRVINNMRVWLSGRTLVVATHRQPVLSLVRRAIVVKNGRPVADGPVEGVLAALSSNRPRAAVAPAEEA
ncbi:type I secretion system permease/ATPase [Chelativorans alearense]|uniref:type I secretion system permease/ATPase n=1 Tax=Chelativorans alearense TaxID=2681495 RepID=UPI0013D4B5A6|nr:type I secretion system permease/ATPase [Chelativorans alearense]